MEVVNNRERGRFELQLSDGDLAFADFHLIAGQVIFPHTVVPVAHEGQGLGSKLAKASLDWAREEGLSVVPQCSFYVTYMKRHSETHDLLAPEYRHLLGL
jgi:predicted GNAT family acetyltransferase